MATGLKSDIDYEPGEGSISADPLFINPNSGDYNLSWGSPCIDSGDPDMPPDPRWFEI